MFIQERMSNCQMCTVHRQFWMYHKEKITRTLSCIYRIGTALLAFYLRMRTFLRTGALTMFVGKSIRLGWSECKPIFFSFSGGSWQVTSSCAYTMASALKLEIGNNRIPYSLKSCFIESFFFRCLRIWLTAVLVTQHLFVAWTHNSCTLPIA